MPSETDDLTPGRDAVSLARDAVTVRKLTLLFAGVLAGASVSVLGGGAVAVPYVGSLPGTLLGAAGIAAALGLFRRGDCCDDCSETDCGCAGECDDSCSYDP